MKRHKAAKARTVAHHHKHVKPAHAHHKAATGHAHKHHKAHKHHHIAKKHKGQVHRGLALGDAVACCAAEALAASLRLSGHPVTDEEMLGLFWLAGGDPDEGLPVLATLEAASESGLAGYRPSFGPLDLDGGLTECDIQDLERFRHLAEHFAEVAEPFHQGDFMQGALTALTCSEYGHGLILGVDLPGPHTVLATPDGWWSWGELWCPWCDFPDAVIEEAWAVSWGTAAAGSLPAYLPRSRHSTLGTASPEVPALSMAGASCL